MSRDDDNHTLSERIHALCAQLSADLNSGLTAHIEDLLTDWQGEDRSELLRQLLGVEIEFRRTQQEDLSVEEFVNRFPNDSSLVQIVFEQSEATIGDSLIQSGSTSPHDFGEYTVLEKIGEGGMGAVYKARHKRMDRVVAIKLLPPKALDSPGAVKRFEREVKAAAKLEHPNVVTAYDAGEANGHHYLVMRYVDGQDLSAYVKQHGPLPVTMAADIIAQAASGLQYAHREGIIHRDVKPSNLLLDRNSTIRILDLGLARLESELDDNSATELTQSGNAMGTVDYMAPEQSADAHTADVRSDVYSLGCTLYYLLTGSAVYGGATLFNRMLAHRDRPVPELTETRPDIPAAVNDLFRKMVAKEPADRYQSMNAVIEALRATGIGDFSVATGSASSTSFSTKQSTPPIDHGLAPSDTHVQTATGAASPSETSISALNQQTVIAQPGPTVISTKRNHRKLIAAVLGIVSVLAIALLVWFNRPVETPDNGEELGNVIHPAEDPPAKAKRKPITWKSGPKENVIAGIIPRPATFDGIRRWQLFTEQPIEWLSLDFRTGPEFCHPKGEQFATISQKNIRVYDTNSRSLIRIIPYDGTGLPTCIAYSHDGKTLAGTYSDGTIRVWDAHTGEVRNEIHEEGRAFIHVSWSPDNQHLTTGSHWTTPAVQRWSLSDGKEQWKTGGSGPVTSTAWSPDGRWFAACSEGWFRIWSIKDEMKEVFNFPKWSTHVRWSNDGKHVSVTLDGQLTILETDTWDVIADQVGVGMPQPVWDFTGQRIFISNRQHLNSYSLSDKQVEHIGSNPIKRNYPALHPNGDMLLTQSIYGPLSYWKQESQKWSTTTARVVDMCKQLTSSADGKWIVSRHPQSATIQVWDWTGRRRHEFSSMSQLAINSKQVLAFAENDGRIRQSYLDNTESLPPLISHNGPVTLLEYQPHGDELLSAGQDGTVRRFDSRGGDVLQVIHQKQPTPIGQISWRPDGQGFGVLTGMAKDAKIVIYSANGEVLATIEPPTDDFIRGFQWHPDGQSLAVPLNKTIQFRSATKEEITAKTAEHVKGIVSTAWHPSGKILATSGGFQDRVVRFWQENGLPAGEMKAGGGWIADMKWSPDGKWLAARSDPTGQHIWIWDHEKRAPGPVFEHFGGEVRISWHPDSKRLASTAGDGTMRIWNVESGEQEQITINLPDAQYVTFDAAGNVIHGDKQTIERSFKYFVEHADGERELLKPSEFYRLTESQR